jgi:hypothetical protein
MRRDAFLNKPTGGTTVRSRTTRANPGSTPRMKLPRPHVYSICIVNNNAAFDASSKIQMRAGGDEKKQSTNDQQGEEFQPDHDVSIIIIAANFTVCVANIPS